MQTKVKRKRGQILAAQYGYLWPIDRHDSGFCLVVNPVSRAYVWAEDKASLQAFVSEYMPHHASN